MNGTRPARLLPVRPLPAVAVACLLLLLPGLARPAGPSPAAVAAQLAARVASSRTTAGRYQALLAVMGTLHVPVFTAAGAALTPGAHGLPARLNLYDFQLRAAAKAMGRGSVLTVDALARLFARAGAHTTPAALAQRLTAGLRAARARPAASSSLVGLLVRDLGLRHRPVLDLAARAQATSALDPLQALLIAVDSAARARGAAPRLPAGRTRAAAPCSDPNLLAQGVGNGPALGPAADPGLVSSLVLVFLYRATVVNTPLRATHYGPAGHAALAGKQLRLGVKVEITDSLPDSVRCGLGTAGASIPPPGPVKGEEVSWNPGDLLKYGSITFDPAGGATGADGISTLVFTPSSEIVPSFGSQYTRKGDATASGVSEGGFAIFFDLAQSWEVSYHRPRGFKFTVSTISFQNTAPDGQVITLPVLISGRVCGDDPYTVPWDITESIRGVPASYQVTLPEELPITTGGGGDFPHEWRLVQSNEGVVQLLLKITPGAPASGTFTPAVGTAQVRVVEDTSCPDNSDG